MKNKITFISISAIIIMSATVMLFTSCGNDGPKTNLTTKITISGGGKTAKNITGNGVTLDGGLVVYGRNNSTSPRQMFSKVLANEFRPFSIALSKGQWEFFAIGWEGTSVTESDPFTGYVRCAVSGINIDGTQESLSIVIDLSNENCFTKPIFSSGFYNISAAGTINNAGEKKFPTLGIIPCATELTDSVLSAGNCDANVGPFNSYKIVWHEYSFGLIPEEEIGSFADSETGSFANAPSATSANGAPESPATTIANPDLASYFQNRISKCMSASDFQNNVNIPTGPINTPSPFVFTILAYSDSACAAGSTPTRYVFNRGLNGGFTNDITMNDGNSSFARISYNQLPTTAINKLFLKNVQSFCDIADPYGSIKAYNAFGAGTALSPYLICNKYQLNDIGGTNFYTAKSSNFKLMKDINFYEGATRDTIDMLEENGNINYTMIGESIAEKTDTSLEFNGTFDGNGKTIRGINLISEYTNLASNNPYKQIGFIRNLGASGVVKDLNISFVMMNRWGAGASFEEIGAIAGRSSGTISNVKVDLVELEGTRNIGGIVGYMADGNIGNKTFATNIRLRGSENIGGIVGTLQDSTANILPNISKVIASGEIKGELNRAPVCINTSYTGESICSSNSGKWEQINGQYMCTVATPEISCISGSMEWITSKNIGGIVGYNSSTAITVINEAKSEVNITGGRNIGGIAGNIGNNIIQKIVNSYVTGNIKSTSCSHLTYVGGLIGYSQAPGPYIHAGFFTEGNIVRPDPANSCISKSYGRIVGNDTGSSMGTNCLGVSSKLTDDALSCGIEISVNGSVYSGFYTDAFLVSLNSNDDNATIDVWAIDDKGYDYPRFTWENMRDCHGKFATTFAGGNGTSDSPYEICHINQLKQLRDTATASGGHYFKLKKHIDLSGETDITQPYLMPFTGVLDGNGKTLIGLNMTGNALGLFSNILGTLANGNKSTVKNLKVFGFKYISNNNSGIIAPYNNGIINNVTVDGIIYGGTSQFYNNDNSGGIVASNHGVIDQARSSVEIFGEGVLGGIAGTNEGGLIIYSDFSGKINIDNFDSNCSLEGFGGIAGKNSYYAGNNYVYADPHITTNSFNYGQNATVAQSKSHGNINVGTLSSCSVNKMKKIGGIVGYNDNSVIKDVVASGSIYDGSSGMSPTGSTKTAYIGGIVGYTSGASASVFNAVANTHIYFGTGTNFSNTYLGIIVGYNSATPMIQNILVKEALPGICSPSMYLNKDDCLDNNGYWTMNGTITEGYNLDNDSSNNIHFYTKAALASLVYNNSFFGEFNIGEKDYHATPTPTIWVMRKSGELPELSFIEDDKELAFYLTALGITLQQFNGTN